MSITYQNIFCHLPNGELVFQASDMNRSISGGAGFNNAKSGDFTFLTNQSSVAKDLLLKCRASLLLIDKRVDYEGVDFSAQGVECVIAVDDARLAFIKVLNRFFPQHVERGVRADSARISVTAKLHQSVVVGEYAVIGDDCTIGENSVIGMHTILHQQTVVGCNTVIESHCTIGSDGFGFQRDENGILHKFPHEGNVVIGDEVEIGCSVCIDRGTMSSTVIGTGSKIDNFVHIAHNVQIGNHVLVVAQAGICGKVSVGDRAYIGPSSCISQGVIIGDDAFVGLGAFVTQDVDAGISVLGRGVGYLVDRRPRELSLGGSWRPKEH